MRIALLRWALAGLALVALASLLDADASAVLSGKTVKIQAAPWTVAVLALGQEICTGVIIDHEHVLTAGHCLFNDSSGARIPISWFSVEAGASNINHPLESDTPQIRPVSAAHLMPGYVPTAKVKPVDALHDAGYDLAVLTLSQPFQLNTATVEAARPPKSDAPQPTRRTLLVAAACGRENPTGESDGSLNEVERPTITNYCASTLAVCTFSRTSGVCPGDSGSALVEPGTPATVVGILSQGQCLGFGESIYNYVGSAPAWRLIRSAGAILPR
jgi:Trypsin